MTQKVDLAEICEAAGVSLDDVMDYLITDETTSEKQ